MQRVIRTRKASWWLMVLMASIVAIATIAVSPLTASAQRGRTDRGSRTDRKTKQVDGKRTPSRARSSRARKSRVKKSRAEKPKVERSRAGKTRTENSRTGQSRTGKSRAGKSRAGASRSRSPSRSKKQRADVRSKSGARSKQDVRSRSRSGSLSGDRSGSLSSDRSGSRSGTRSDRLKSAGFQRESSDLVIQDRSSTGRDRKGGRTSQSGRSGTTALGRSSRGSERSTGSIQRSRSERAERNVRSSGNAGRKPYIESRRRNSDARIRLPSVRRHAPKGYREFDYEYRRHRKRVRFAPLIRWYPAATLRIYWPRIHVNIDWPWSIRYRRHWRPRYRYRQVVYVRTRHRREYREERLEFETRYSHSVRYADDEKAEIDIRIEAIDVYSRGRLLGSVDRIPNDLAEIQATVTRNGDVYFDRDVFIVGDSYRGFEIVSTRHYNGNVLDDYRPDDGYLAGRLDLRSGSVYRIGRSRLFDPYGSSRYVPISLLPEDDGWLWDYGTDAISAAADDYGFYYGYKGASSISGPAYRSDPVDFSRESEYRTRNGTNVFLKRESQLQRIE